jgi:hypothetical protein
MSPVLICESVLWLQVVWQSIHCVYSSTGTGVRQDGRRAWAPQPAAQSRRQLHPRSPRTGQRPHRNRRTHQRRLCCPRNRRPSRLSHPPQGRPTLRSCEQRHPVVARRGEEEARSLKTVSAAKTETDDDAREGSGREQQASS